MSSRNAYLAGEQRTAATVLYRALQLAQAKISAGVRDALQVQEAMRSVLLKEPLAKIDYAEIVDAETFEPVVKVNNGSYALLAVYIGRTRLIDNLFIDVQGDQVRTEL